MPEPANPHDRLFKVAFSKPESAASQLRALLPAELVSALDLTRLRALPAEFVDEDLRATQSDLLFEVPLMGRRALVYALYEHQSTPDPLMPFRLLRYVVRIWDRWLEEQAGGRQRQLPPVIPIVLYNGERRWNEATSLQELYDLPPAALGAIAPLLPQLTFALDDLTQRTDEELRARASPPLALGTLVLFKHARGDRDLLSAWRSLADVITQLMDEPDWALGLQQLARYTYTVGEVTRDDLSRVVGTIAGSAAQETVMTTAEKLRLEGRLEGRRDSLLQLLQLKFQANLTPELTHRVDAASLEQLEAWIERVLSAATLADVFAD